MLNTQGIVSRGSTRPTHGEGEPEPDEDDDEAEASEAAELLRHNAAFDRWERMTDAEREREIRDAIRKGGE